MDPKPNRYSPPRSPLPADIPVPPSPKARPLNVKDALSYLEMVKVKFPDNPDVYNRFLDIMKDFKSQAIDTPGVIERVSSLFNGHTALIQGFKALLPHGYRIDCTVEDDHSLITVTTPSGTTTQTTGGPSRHALSNHASPAPYPSLTALVPDPLPPLPASPYYQGASPATIHAVAALQSGGQSLIPSANQAAAASIASASAIRPDVLAQKGVPHTVEFNQAVNYVTRIQQRFASNPDTYKQFLEILQTYQKDQCSIAEVHQQVNVLFNNQRDLLEDFQYYLPDHYKDAGNASGQSVGGATLFSMTAQTQAAEASWEDKSTKGKGPSTSSGAPLNKPGLSTTDKNKHEGPKEHEREKERERDQERLEKETHEREKEEGKLVAKLKKRGLENESENNEKPGGNSKRSKVVSRGGMEEATYGGNNRSISNQPANTDDILSGMAHRTQGLSIAQKRQSSKLAHGSHPAAQSQSGLNYIKNLAPDSIILGGLFQSSIQSPPVQNMQTVRSGEMTPLGMLECLIGHGCSDLRLFVDPDRYSSCRVAEGGFGDVWKGQLVDGTSIAIKVLRYGLVYEDESKSVKRAMREIYNWSKLEHKNIHKLLGVTMFQERLGMVSVWMEHGTLRQYLQQHYNVDRYAMIAEGVAYLHGMDMIHGDLKACNILVSTDGVLKLTDFDYSIISGHSLVFSATTRTGGGSLRWMAPELLLATDENPAERNKQTDIYALGMTFLASETSVPIERI
ncbi:unnamed protein product [Rhizoctonia solani]|uniref:Protein kinase domain-containing protein n=1 Tax=Rhizoctonia solani TaxID=456999 RepID=A0A8H3HFG4_9AGAM|nr:unnamed protein product [Rhizoctonia solani]CAE6526472.1 unnamed protein product [Rhizoctonia solani]